MLQALLYHEESVRGRQGSGVTPCQGHSGLPAAPRGWQTILYLGARELEVGIIESPQGGARFTVYQPGFVITSREVVWSLRNGKAKEKGGGERCNEW